MTQGDGPWGALAWTYDRIGNRLSETRNSVTDTYAYVPNAAFGNSAQLDEIQLGAGSTRGFTYDAAGNQTQVDTAGDMVDRAYDDAGRLSRQERTTAAAVTSFLYDGRSFLRHAAGVTLDPPGAGTIFCDGFESGDLSAWGSGSSLCPTLATTEPTYSSEGILHRVAAPAQAHAVFYFAGRPIAQLAESGDFLYLTTDHLGTSILATGEAGSVEWQGGFEPFGADFSGASAAGVFLRFPGQWENESWAESGPGSGTGYNLHRWYQAATGRYNRPDPLGLRGGHHPYLFALSSPTTLVDPFGLYTIDDSCKCPNVDPPGSPGAGFGPSQLDDLERELGTWCQALAARITDKKLRKCLEKSCERGKIKCDRDCPPGMGGFNEPRVVLDVYRLVNRTANFCLNNLPGSIPTGWLGDAAIHEFSHGCRWRHRDGKGVPLDPGM